MKNKLNRTAAIILAILMLALPGSLIAREKRGATLVIMFKDGHFAEGELIAVKPDSLLLLAGKDESVDLAEVSSLRIVRKSKAGVGALGGLLAGIAGTVLYVSLQKEPDNLWDGAWQGIGNAGAAVMFVGSGLGVGLTVGALAGKDKVIRFEGRPESEIKKNLAYLRSKARIRDFK